MSKQWGKTKLDGWGNEDRPEEIPEPMEVTLSSLGVSSQGKVTKHYRERNGLLMQVACDSAQSTLELVVRQHETDGSIWVTLRTYEKVDIPDEAPDQPHTVVLFEGPMKVSIAQAFAQHFYHRKIKGFAVDVLHASTPDDPFYNDDSVALPNKL